MASHSRPWHSSIGLEPWGTGLESFQGWELHNFHLAQAGLLFGVVLLPAPTAVGTTGTEAVVGMVTLILVRGLQVFLGGLHFALLILQCVQGILQPPSPSRSG